MGPLVRAHCWLSWEREGQDGSGCANLTGERGGGRRRIGEKGVSERFLLLSGAAVHGCDGRNRSRSRNPSLPGWAFGVK